jgi:hypothetical protein
MNRRTLLQHTLALLGLPPALAGAAIRSPSPGDLLPDAPAGTVAGFGPASGSPPPSWLQAWLRLPMRPVLGEGDLDADLDHRSWETALGILTCLGRGETLRFRYCGGSEPGSPRAVLPVLLFRKFDPDLADSDAANRGPLYLLAHCQTRSAARTFRLDRIELC